MSKIEKLAKDLQNAFPDIEGFYGKNSFRMRAFYLKYGNISQAKGQLMIFQINREREP